jgi:hypothetical protein
MICMRSLVLHALWFAGSCISGVVFVADERSKELK